MTDIDISFTSQIIDNQNTIEKQSRSYKMRGEYITKIWHFNGNNF